MGARGCRALTTPLSRRNALHPLFSQWRTGRTGFLAQNAKWGDWTRCRDACRPRGQRNHSMILSGCYTCQTHTDRLHWNHKEIPMSSLLSQKHLQDEQAAYDWVEAHVWPDGPVCPHCGSVERISKMAGKTTRFGLYKCYACRQPFKVKVGTIFEKSHVPMHLWLQAFFLMASSKKGISANQLHRTLGVTLKSAWFMSPSHPRSDACGVRSPRPWAARAAWWRLTRPSSAAAT